MQKNRDRPKKAKQKKSFSLRTIEKYEKIKIKFHFCTILWKPSMI